MTQYQLQMQTRTEWNRKQVPMRHLAALANHLQLRDISSELIHSDTGISRQDLRRAESRITYQQFFTVIENLLNLPVPDDFFLSRTHSFNIADYGILGYAMMSAATMGKAIQIALKYHQTIGAAIKPELCIRGQNVELQAVNFLKLPDNLLAAVVEETFSSFPPLLNLLTGSSATVKEIRFSFPDSGKPKHIYTKVFGCEPEFNCSSCSFVMDSAILHAPLVQADANAARLLEKSCQEMLAHLSENQNFGNKVQHMLLNSPRRLNAEQVAERMNIGVRTLRRRLADESQSFQSLSDQVRRRLATDYLCETKLSNQEIGELLGFTEATNFRRAFLRWTGQTPKAYRIERERPDVS